MERRSSSQTLAHWPTRSLGDVAICCDMLRYVAICCDMLRLLYIHFSRFMFWPVSKAGRKCLCRHIGDLSFENIFDCAKRRMYNAYVLLTCVPQAVWLRYGIRVNTISAGPLKSRAASAIGGDGEKTFIERAIDA